MADSSPVPLRRKLGVVAALLALLAGCSTTPVCDRTCISSAIQTRTGHDVGPPPPQGQVILPNGVNLEDGLTEEGAVLIALWNNALFQEQLADLGIAYGDLVQAGILPNPEFLYGWPMHLKAFKYLIDFPIESLWLRPIRVAAATSENERVCKRLTQAGLDLIRDVRQAYSDALLASARLKVAEEILRVRQRTEQIAAKRLKEGDISKVEAATPRIDALQAEQDVIRLRQDVEVTTERLRQLLSIGTDRCALRLADVPLPIYHNLMIDPLVEEAIGDRPDAQAAAQATAAAAERLRLSKLIWFRLLCVLDATSGFQTDHEPGPLVRFTVPIFNRNQGGIARAEAELDRAERNQRTVRDQIIFDVRQAHARYVQALAEYQFVEQKVRPEVLKAIELNENAYREGETLYLNVLQATQQLLAARLREEQLRGDLRRAAADLERGVGRRLDLLPPPAKPDGVKP
jgi:cobalt-zinc-cadmium efflux system outer membrane protein